jgi:small subunit ribosomal protein S6
MRQYEVMFLMRPDTPEAQVDAKITHYQSILQEGGSRLVNAEKLGRRRTAYRLPEFGLDEVYYSVFRFEGDGAVNAELERRMRLDDELLRFLLLRTDEDARYAEKQAKIREADKARRAKRVAARTASETRQRPQAPAPRTEPSSPAPSAHSSPEASN